MHEKIDGDLLALIEGRLSAEETERVRAWLAADPKLAQQVAGMVRDREMLRRLPKASAPPGLAEGVLARLERGTLLMDFEQEAGAARRKIWQTRLAIAASIAVLAGGLGFVLVEGLITHQSPWRDWADKAQLAKNDETKLAEHAADLGPLAAAGRKDQLIAKALPTASPTESMTEQMETRIAAGPPAPAIVPAAPLTRPPLAEATPPDAPHHSAAKGFHSIAKGGGGIPGAAPDASAKERAPVLAELPQEPAGSQTLAQAGGKRQTGEDGWAQYSALRDKRAGADAPVVFTVAVRDAADADQLQRTLASFASAESVDRLASASTITVGGNARDGSGNGTLENQKTAAGNMQLKPGGGNGGSLNGDNSYAGNTTVGGNLGINSAATAGNATVNNSGTVLAERQNLQNNVQGNATLNTQQSDDLAQNRARSLTGQLAMPMSRAQQGVAQQSQAGGQGGYGYDVAGTSYHLRLTPQQIQLLSSNFQVQSVTLGAVANADRAETGRRTSNEEYRQEYLAKADPAASPEPVAPSASASKAAHAPARHRHKSGKAASPAASAPMMNATQAPQNTADVNKAKAAAGPEGAGEDIQLVDCIINIVPATHANAAARNAEVRPAK
jgi:hypothetical protein